MAAAFTTNAGLAWRLRRSALVIGTLVSCSDPTGFDARVQFAPPKSGAAGTGTRPVIITPPTAAPDPAEGEEDLDQVCPASSEWLPHTPTEVELFNPEPHPSPECPFYRGGYQNFLIATELDARGEPAIVSYPTIDDLFQSATPHGVRNTSARAWLGDIKQAGQRAIVIDQNGHSLYYGIHVNQAFADFVNANGLTTLAGVQNADPNLYLPSGVVEFKTAWLDIDPADGVDPTQYQNYITTTGWVPTLSKDAQGNLREDKDTPRRIRLALIAMHVVYAFPGHPELIWTSFQHVDADHNPDTAPSFDVNPVLTDPDNLGKADVVSGDDFLLYRGGTPANRANQYLPESQLTLDVATQSFPTSQQTSIYRMFPGSKSNDIVPDDDVVSLNINVRAVFEDKAAQFDARDKRRFYELVGATWLDKPEVFAVDNTLQNDAKSPLLQGQVHPEFGEAEERATILADGSGQDVADLAENGTQSPFSILGGEERMSSTAMESFTQGPAAFFNCFTCHNTSAINASGIPLGRDNSRKLLDPKLINVSHIFSQFVLQETE
jgi:hypothetical protein